MNGKSTGSFIQVHLISYEIDSSGRRQVCNDAFMHEAAAIVRAESLRDAVIETHQAEIISPGNRVLVARMCYLLDETEDHDALIANAERKLSDAEIEALRIELRDQAIADFRKEVGHVFYFKDPAMVTPPKGKKLLAIWDSPKDAMIVEFVEHPLQRVMRYRSVETKNWVGEPRRYAVIR